MINILITNLKNIHKSLTHIITITLTLPSKINDHVFLLKMYRQLYH